MINWMEMNVETVRRNKKAQERLPKAVGTEVANDPDQTRVEALEGLPDEFSGNADPRGDACSVEHRNACCVAQRMECCAEPKCPCHEEK